VITLLLSSLLALQGIPVQAQQAGTVSGVLKDSEGKPLPGIRMAAIARPQSLDEAVTSAAMSSLAETDEQGRYTLEGIPPGRYYIAAGRLDAQTYYPGTTNMAMAKEVVITAGSTLSGIDFALGDLSFGRASSRGGLVVGVNMNATAAIPLRVTVEGGGKIPLSAGGKFITVKLDMGTAITTPISSTVVNIPGPQTTAYRVTVENLPETYAVKSLTYGSTDLLTGTLRLTPPNFPRSTSIAVSTTAGANPPVLQLPQNEGDLLNYLFALAAGRGLIVAPVAPAPPPAPASTVQITPPLSWLSITLKQVAPNPVAGVRVSGRLSAPGNRMVYASGIPGTVYSDGTFEVHGVPPGRHSIVARDNRLSARPLAAAVVVANGNLDGIVLTETAALPHDAWDPAPPRPAGDHPAGSVPLARITGTLVEESSRKPIAEGTVMIKSNGSSTVSFPVDSEGGFELPPLLPGTYDLEVQVFGHSSAKQSLEIDDKNMKLELVTRKLY
jgi:hypothetical protein